MGNSSFLSRHVTSSSQSTPLMLGLNRRDARPATRDAMRELATRLNA